ncbi:MAG: 50S ribosomal protein L35 [Candidatus Gracilibacteria bacterium]|nr:50S ribosomal protein L35 [Candidatus Gracilibacteria bacterium]
MTLKTRSGVKKRVKVTSKGKFKLAKAWKKHLLSDKSKKAKGRNRYGLIASSTETRKIKQQLPFA